MINFTVGPVQSNHLVREVASQQIPYFRTPEFSAIMLENERRMLALSGAPDGSRAVFLTGSGTAAMEAAVINTLTPNDKALVVNGGGFGRRFAKLLEIHDIPYDEIVLSVGQALTAERLSPFEQQGYTAFLVNIHETETGVLYDMDLIGDFCRRNGLLLIADGISSFLADKFSMEDTGADVLIVGAQKALACDPGVSVLILSPAACERIEKIDPKSMYFDLKDALNNQIRGQTPFTPAVGILRQIHARLQEIVSHGGAEKETARIAGLAAYFRKGIQSLPFTFVSETMSNAATALHPMTASAYDIFSILKDEYSIWVCPNGGDLRDEVLRIGHIGNITTEDYDTLLDALHDLQRRGII